MPDGSFLLYFNKIFFKKERKVIYINEVLYIAHCKNGCDFNGKNATVKNCYNWLTESFLTYYYLLILTIYLTVNNCNIYNGTFNVILL